MVVMVKVVRVVGGGEVGQEGPPWGWAGSCHGAPEGIEFERGRGGVLLPLEVLEVLVRREVLLLHAPRDHDLRGPRATS